MGYREKQLRYGMVPQCPTSKRTLLVIVKRLRELRRRQGVGGSINLEWAGEVWLAANTLWNNQDSQDLDHFSATWSTCGLWKYMGVKQFRDRDLWWDQHVFLMELRLGVADSRHRMIVQQLEIQFSAAIVLFRVARSFAAEACLAVPFAEWLVILRSFEGKGQRKPQCFTRTMMS